MSKAVQVGQLVINMAADIATLKTSLAEGVRESKSSAEKMASELSAIRKGFEEAVAPLQNLTIKIGTLEATLARAQSTALSLGKGLILGAAAGMSIDGIAKKINGVIESMANLKTISEKTGSSVENLSKLSFAAKQSGSDLDSVASALAKMSKGMAGADDETKGAGRALAFLGVSAKDSAGNLKDPAAMFVEIAKKLDGYAEGAGKAVIAQALFGKAGADLLPTLKLIGEQGDIVAKVTDAQASAARQYQRDLAKLDAQKSAVFKTISTALLPTMTDFAGAMLDASKKTNMTNDAVKGLQSDGSITDWADSAAMGLARLIDVIVFIPKALKAVSSSFQVVAADAKLGITSAYLASPTGLGRTLGAGKNPITELKAALDERNKVLADANAKYSDLWNYDGAAMEKAMAARIAARAKDRNKDEKDRPSLNFSTVNDDSKGGPSLNSLIAGAQAALDGEKSIYDARVKMLDLYHAKFGLADAEFYAGRENARAEYIAAEAIAYAKESSLALAAQAKARSPEEVTAAKDKYAQLVKAHNDFVQSMSEAGGADRANEAADSQKQYDDMTKAVHDAGVATISSLDQQIAKQREHNSEIGKTKEQIELAKQAQLDLETKQLQSDADYLRDGMAKWDLDEKSRAAYQIRLTDLDAEIERRRTLASLHAEGANAEAVANANAELDKFLDPTKAEKFGNALKGAFGGAAESLGKLADVMAKYGAQQAAIEKARAEAAILSKGDEMDRAKAVLDLDAINRRSTNEQLASYGNMASAAAGFFDHGSRGYKALQTASEVMHAAQLAMNLASIAPAMAAGAAQFFAQSGWGGFAGVAAMAAVVAGFGVAVSGGGNVNVSANRQASQGTGTILGDDDAKSESLKKSLDLIEKNTYQGLAVDNSMLATLRSIDSNISSFASHLVQSGVISGANVETSNSGLYNSLNSSAASGLGTLAGAGVGYMAGAGLSAFTSLAALGGPIGLVVGAIAGKYLGSALSSIFGGKQSVSDTGFTLDKTSLGGALAGGVHGVSYADITTSGGWFRGDSHDTKTGDLGADADQQFSAIIKSLAASITQAGQMLGVSGDDFSNHLNSFVIDIGKVSLKDLKGDELQKALESVFSKLGDQMAAYAVDGLQEFQQVGEGYLETLTRLATEYQTVDVVFQSFGKTFGTVGLASIGARDRLVQLAGGLDKFTSQGEYFLSNFFSEQEQATALRKRIDPMLAQYGLSSAGENAAQAFRDFVVSLDTTTEAGAQAYTTLMTIAPALKSVIGAEKDVLDERKTLQDKLDELTLTSAQLREKERAAVDASNLALYDRVAALQAEKDAASTLLGNVDSSFSVLQKVVEREKKAVQTSVDAHTAAVSKLQSLSQSLRSTLDSIKSPDQQVLARAAAQSQIRAVLASVKAGGALPDVDSLKDALSAVSKGSTDQFGTSQDYLRDLYQTQNDIAGLADITDDSLSVEQKALEVAKDQISRLDAIVANGQAQVDGIKGQSLATLSLAQAIAGLQTALGSAQANPSVSATSAISKAYLELLGRPADDAGLEFWQKAAANGASIDEIRSLIKGSAEYKGIPGFATGGDFGGGWRLVGERGPEIEATGPARIFNASQTSDLFSRLTSPSSNNDALAAEVRELRVIAAKQQATLDKIEQSTRRSADMYDNATAGGNAPMLVEIA